MVGTILMARQLAQLLWLYLKPDLRAAVAEFKRMWHGNPVSRPDKLFKRWMERDGSAPVRSGGRPRIVPPAHAKKLAALFMEGYIASNGERHGFRTVDDAKKKSNKFRDLAAKHKCNDKTLMAAMKCANPALGRITQRVKQVLRKGLKKQRQRVARQLFRSPAYVRKACIFLDESSWGPCNLSGPVWGNKKEGQTTVTHPLAPRTNDDLSLLHFCVGVTYAEGPSFICFLTGTRGMKAKGFKVGHSPWLPSALPGRWARSPGRCHPATRAAHTHAWHRLPT